MASLKTRRGRSVVVGCFVAFFLCYGTLQTLGVYMISLSAEFDTTGYAVLGWICSAGLAVSFLSGPIVSIIISRFGCRRAAMFGGALHASGLILSSFATSIPVMFLFLGVVTGFGGSFIYTSIPVIVGHYFTKSYSTANGIAFCGISVGMMAFPPFIEVLTETYGWRGAFQIQGAFNLNIIAMAAIFRPVSTKEIGRNREREQRQQLQQQTFNSDVATSIVDRSLGAYELCGIPETKLSANNTNNDANSNIQCRNPESMLRGLPSENTPKWYPSRLLLVIKAPFILFLFVACFLANIAFAVSVIHTANQVELKGYSTRKAAFALSSMGIGGIFGRLFHGLPVDKKIMKSTTLYMLTVAFAAVSSVINPILNSYVGCVTSATCIGVAVGVIFPLECTILREIVGMSCMVPAVGLTLFIDGLGVMVGGFLAGAVKDITGDYDAAFYIGGAIYFLVACSILPLCVRQKYNRL